jgi:UDP-N-acetylglucosamine 1-carboxyvinyltransferase
MLAAATAQGETVIEGAACEPEIVDLANCLKKMGAKISGAGTHIITIKGVKFLKPVEYTVIPDRIETGTFIMAAAITKSKIKILNVNPRHLRGLIDKLKDMNIKITASKNYIRTNIPRRILPTDITTLPYPGFPTDLQAQFMALATTAKGISIVNERIYPDRFMHVSELMRMGANIIREGPQAIIKGEGKLSGAPVMASDLRASAALVMAGLVARGTTEISRVYHIDRGYENIEDKLRKLGAKIRRIKG